MSSVTIRNIPEATHRALKLRAAQHGRSTEAEIRDILQKSVMPKRGIGSALVEIGQSLGGVEFTFERDQRPIDPASFE